MTSLGGVSTPIGLIRKSTGRPSGFPVSPSPCSSDIPVLLYCFLKLLLLLSGKSLGKFDRFSPSGPVVS